MSERIAVIRFPAKAAEIILYHPEFRFLGCSARLHGDWVKRVSDQEMFFEIRDCHVQDGEEFLRFAHRVAANLLEPRP